MLFLLSVLYIPEVGKVLCFFEKKYNTTRERAPPGACTKGAVDKIRSNFITAPCLLI
jgi:hypothetical protein